MVVELVLSEDPRYSIVFTIGIGDSESGPRIGGRSPMSVSTLNISDGRFFATMPVSKVPPLEASIFLDWQRFENFENVPVNRLQRSGRELVEILLMGPTIRKKDSSFSGPLSEHPLNLGSLAEDETINEDEEKCVRSGHKLGGTAYLIQPRNSLVSELETLTLEGYRHVVQFDYMAPGDAEWQGRWPFGDGLFNVFGKPPFEDGSWRWLWQY